MEIVALEWLIKPLIVLLFKEVWADIVKPRLSDNSSSQVIPPTVVAPTIEALLALTEAQQKENNALQTQNNELRNTLQRVHGCSVLEYDPANPSNLPPEER